jgi:sulfate permease, SulP family
VTIRASDSPPARLARILPIVGWARTYDRRWLRGDLVAGIAVTAMIVPKNLGYADIAGIPVENGLYAAAAGAIIYALFCTSRHISTGPSSSLAAVAGGAVILSAVTGPQAAQLVAAIALVTGLLFLVMAALRMGWIARFLSRAVVTGFLAGAAIDVIIGELPKLTGTSATGTNAWQELASWARGLADTQVATLVIGALALVTIIGLRMVAPRVPGALILVVGGLVASSLLDLGARGVALVGPVPSGFPAPMLPPLEVVTAHVPEILIASLALVLIGFSQTAGDARTFATRHGYRVDIDQESVAQGMANLGAGVFQGMPVSTSLSASSLNESAGARTPVASLAAGALVLATLVLLAPLFADLPKAILAAVIVDAVLFGMIDIGEMRRLRRVKRFDFWIAMAAVLGVLSAGVLLGVVIGIVLSVGWLLHVATGPAMPLLGRQPGTHVFRDLDEHPEGETYPDVAALRIDGGIFFATAESLDDRVRSVLDLQPGLRTLVLDLEGVNFVDAQGAAKLTELLGRLASEGQTLRLAHVKPNVLEVLIAEGFLELLGPERVHGTVHRAVKAHLEEPGRLLP